ncbi:phage integrase family protein [Pseudomonas sp. GM79]|uniref:tyrosine-type recombinase/integrase n=1 Tax=Pseudomonas sp. GM79 TaxID=1144338 RepID=UPI00026F47B6|nr:integrase arm-type DNA-binding domain-containing protein [Pseudomonas sp. GM79]EJN19597.1 phage integrase family protein [Pseudomonas sp. GM79]
MKTRQQIELLIRREKPNPLKKIRIACGDGLCLVINKGGSKIFTSRYRLPNQKNAEDYSHSPPYPEISLTEAFKKHYILMEKVKEGINPKLEQKEKALKEASEPTLNEVAKDYFSKALLRESTLNDYKTRYEKWVSSKIGQLKLKNIDSADCINHIQIVKNESGKDSYNKGDGTRTASIIKTILSQIFIHAVLDGKLKLSRNPMLGISSKMLGIQQKHNQKKRVLSQSEIVETWRKITLHEQLGMLLPASAASIHIAILTGMRRQEIVGMQHDELQKLEDGSAIYHVPSTRMKGGVDHQVFLSKFCMNIINRLQTNTIYAFPSSRYVDRPINKETMNNSIRSIFGVRRPKPPIEMIIDIPWFSPHDLRRSFSSGLMNVFKTPKPIIHSMIAHGNDDDDDSEGLGYDTTLDKIYVIADEFNEKKSYWQQWSDHIERLVSQPDER